jgi:UDP-sugar pyrophosphorylase
MLAWLTGLRRWQGAGLPIECAASAERDAYAINGLLLRLAGAHVDPGTTSGTYGGMDIKMPALVTLLPSFGTCLSDVKRHLSADAKISVSARSALVLDGDIDVQGTLELDGALEIRALPGCKVVIKNLKVHNKGWHVEATDEESDVLTAMRGFRVVKLETESKVYTDSGVHVIDHWW